MGSMIVRKKTSLKFLILMFTFLFLAQVSGVIPYGTAHAEPTFTVSPSAAAATSLPERVTVTSSESSFTAGNSTPYLLLNGVVQDASITSVNAAGSEVSFTVGAGLTENTYTVRIVSQQGTYDVGTLTIGDPSIASISPASLANGYDEQQTITVSAQNTNFSLGQSSVEILDGNGDVTGYVGSVTSVPSSTQLAFTVDPGLSSGTYSVRVTTGDEVVTAAGVLEVRGAPFIGISPSQVTEGYSSTMITVTGTDTGFSDQTTVSVLEGGSATGNAGTPTVSGEGSLSFSLSPGLAAGSYVVAVSTGSEEAQTSLTVVEPSVSLQYQGSDFSELKGGYASSYGLTLSGTNTSFSQGTTEVALFNSNSSDISSTYISSVSVSSSSTTTFTLATGLAVGDYTISATTGDEVVSDTFTVLEPQLQSVTFNSPVVSASSVPKGYTDIQVDVVGVNTSFQDNTAVTVVDQTEKATRESIQDSTHLSFYLEDGLSAGSYTFQIDMDGSSSTTGDQLTYAFTVTSPSILSISPNSIVNSSSSPQTITVTGENTHFTAATPSIDITGTTGETVSSINVVSDTELSFSVTPNTLNAGTYGLTITTGSSSISETASGAAELLTASDSGFDPSLSTIYTDELGSKTITLSGTNTSFVSGTTTVSVGSDQASAIQVTATVSSSTQLFFTVPTGLSTGQQTIYVDEDGDGTNDNSNTFNVNERSINLSSTSKMFGYSSFTQTVTGQGVSFSDQNKPVVKISDGSDEEVISSTDISVSTSQLSFQFPTGKATGSYTLQASWTSGQYSGLELTKGFEVTAQVSDLHLTKDGQNVNSITVTEDFVLKAMAEMVSGGDDQDKSSAAQWQSSDDSVLTVDSSGGVIVEGTGTATITASYDTSSAAVQVTVQDITAPEVDSRTPANGATGVAINSSITVSFSEELTSGIINSSNFKLYKGNSVVASSTTSNDAQTVTLNPVNALDYGTEYTVELGMGITDAAGNALAEEVSWSFKTGSLPDTEVPTVDTKNPIANAVDVAVTSDITAVFSEALDAGTINSNTIKLLAGSTSVDGDVSYDVTTYTVTFSPTDDLENATEYTIELGTGITDLAGNALAAKETWLFTTASAGTTPLPSGGGGPVGGAPPLLTETPVVVRLAIPSGEQAKDLTEAAATVTTETDADGRVAARVVLDAAKMISAIEEATGGEKLFKVDVVAEDVQETSAEISAEVFEALKQKDADSQLQLNSSVGSLLLPSKSIDLDALKKKLGVSSSSSVSISINMKKVDESTSVKVADAVSTAGYQVVDSPVEFTIEASSENEKVKLADFNGFVTRRLTVNKADLDIKMATGVVFDPDTGALQHVPTMFTKDSNGNILAELKRKGDSIYTVIEASKSFTDMDAHWAKQYVEPLASKLVVNGTGENRYEPERPVTRAEFAALLVRSLGMDPDAAASGSFNDLAEGAWYVSSVGAANANGLVKGYNDNSFRPNQRISRVEMAVMVTRALAAAEANIVLTSGEKESMLAGFVDVNQIPDWSASSVATAVKAGIINGKGEGRFAPIDDATRAEAATMILRMMRTANLSN